MSCLLFLQGNIPAKFYILNIIHVLVKEEAMAAFLMLSPSFFFFLKLNVIVEEKIYRIAF